MPGTRVLSAPLVAQNRFHSVPFINPASTRASRHPESQPMRTTARFRSKKANRINKKYSNGGAGVKCVWGHIFESATHTPSSKEGGKAAALDRWRFNSFGQLRLSTGESRFRTEYMRTTALCSGWTEQWREHGITAHRTPCDRWRGKKSRNPVGHCGRKSRCCRCSRKYEQTQITSSENSERGTEKTKQP